MILMCFNSPFYTPNNQQHLVDSVYPTTPIIQLSNYNLSEFIRLESGFRYAYQIIDKILPSKKELSKKKIKFDERSCEWYYEEQNGQRIRIGKYSIKACRIIGFKPDETYVACFIKRL